MKLLSLALTLPLPSKCVSSFITDQLNTRSSWVPESAVCVPTCFMLVGQDVGCNLIRFKVWVKRPETTKKKDFSPFPRLLRSTETAWKTSLWSLPVPWDMLLGDREHRASGGWRREEPQGPACQIFAFIRKEHPTQCAGQLWVWFSGLFNSLWKLATSCHLFIGSKGSVMGTVSTLGTEINMPPGL